MYRESSNKSACTYTTCTQVQVRGTSRMQGTRCNCGHTQKHASACRRTMADTVAYDQATWHSSASTSPCQIAQLQHRNETGTALHITFALRRCASSSGILGDSLLSPRPWSLSCRAWGGGRPLCCGAPMPHLGLGQPLTCAARTAARQPAGCYLSALFFHDSFIMIQCTGGKQGPRNSAV